MLAKYQTEGSPLLSGYLIGEKFLQGRAAALDVRLGNGHVVLIGFRPQWRGQPFGTFRMLFNAALYHGAIAAAAQRYARILELADDGRRSMSEAPVDAPASTDDRSRLAIRLIVFDLDGTLVDSHKDLAAAANALVLELGGAPITEEAVARMVGDGAAVLVRRALAASGLKPDTPSALDRFLAIYDTCLLDQTRPYPGMVETLEQLATRYRLGVLTNKPTHATKTMLDGLDLVALFPAGGRRRHAVRPQARSRRPAAHHRRLGRVGSVDDARRGFACGPRNRPARRRSDLSREVWFRLHVQDRGSRGR